MEDKIGYIWGTHIVVIIDKKYKDKSIPLKQQSLCEAVFMSHQILNGFNGSPRSSEMHSFRIFYEPISGGRPKVG